MMTATANDFSSIRNAPELTHFGDHGQRLFSSSAKSVPESRRLENDSLVTMTVDQTFEIEKDMNCLDILAGVVSRCSSSEIELKPPMYNSGGSGSNELCRSLSEKSDLANPQEHRVSCHRCGNIRKRKIVCERPQCPHIFCGRCADKMKNEHGVDAFLRGCPVCQELCCCVNKTVYCNRKNHCYRKCPASKCADPIAKSNTPMPMWDYDTCGMTKQRGDTINLGPISSISTNEGIAGEDPQASNDAADFYRMPLNKICLSKNGSLDFLAAAVSIMDRNESNTSPSKDSSLIYHDDCRVTLPLELQGADSVRKRHREVSSTAPSESSNATAFSASSRSHNSGDQLCQSSENNKTFRTGSHLTLNESPPPPPAYFLAQSLLPSSKKQVSPGRRDDSNRGEMCFWRKIPQPVSVEAYQSGLQIDAPSYGDPDSSHYNRSNFISNNSSPINRINNSQLSSSLSQDYIRREFCNLGPSPDLNGSFRNIREENITRKLISGPNEQELAPYLARSNSPSFQPLFPFPKSSSSLGYYKPIGGASSQLLPPPL